jgi:glutathione synthase/RimK-type ligase-like ATP-grasp enzyme
MTDKAILILGDDDEHALHMLEYLRQRGREAILLDSRWFPTELTVAFDPQTGAGSFEFPDGGQLNFTEIQSIYWRSYSGIGPSPLPDPEQAWIAENDSRSLFESLLIRLPARWVNGWEGFQLHQTKPAQLARVAALGVPIPPTILGNDPARVREFANVHGSCIVKPVQGGDYTVRITAGELTPERLERLQFAPITVQAEVPGTNIRVFVAGDRVLACEVRTAAADFREDQQAELLVHFLPPEIAMQSQRIARELCLLWTGIDYRLTPAGEYVFLEANPSPMFLGFEAQTGLPLTESLANLLLAD